MKQPLDINLVVVVVEAEDRWIEDNIHDEALTERRVKSRMVM